MRPPGGSRWSSLSGAWKCSDCELIECTSRSSSSLRLISSAVPIDGMHSGHSLPKFSAGGTTVTGSEAGMPGR